MASLVDMPITFNHGVEGSSPSALTNEINRLGQFTAARIGAIFDRGHSWGHNAL
ncbi:hypothetical protein V1277_006271 [Bradyrhizobium sp. AZCC 1588]